MTKQPTVDPVVFDFIAAVDEALTQCWRSGTTVFAPDKFANIQRAMAVVQTPGSVENLSTGSVGAFELIQKIQGHDATTVSPRDVEDTMRWLVRGARGDKAFSPYGILAGKYLRDERLVPSDVVGFRQGARPAGIPAP